MWTVVCFQKASRLLNNVAIAVQVLVRNLHNGSHAVQVVVWLVLPLLIAL